MQGSLEEDFAALRRLRDASGALKEFFGDGEDPREWRGVTVADGRVTELSVFGCSSLVALPDAIGELGALTTLNLLNCRDLAALPVAIGELKALTKLNLRGCLSLAALPDAIGGLGALTKLNLTKCSSLAALPDSIGKLGALSTLNLDDCSSLAYPPEEMRGDVHKTVGFCCLNLLEGGNPTTSSNSLQHDIV